MLKFELLTRVAHEGDDIGLEVVPETIKVMRAAAAKARLDIEWHPVPIGRKAFDEVGNTMPPGTLDKLNTLDGWVLGPIGHQAYPKNNHSYDISEITRCSAPRSLA